MEPYRTIGETASDEFVERRSRFIGTIRPVVEEEEALAFIKEQRERYWDANHNVYAYCLRDGQTRRYSDDGEPQGTAGLPVLEVLQKEGLTDLCVVVTRYFGGILLGAGGLVRAYSHGAKLAVDAARVRVMTPAVELGLDLDYGLYGKVSYLLPQHRVETLDADFGVAVRLRLLIREGELRGFTKALTELTAGALFPYELGRYYADMGEE